GVVYTLFGTVLYESRSKVLVSVKNVGMGGDGGSETVMDEDILSNHMELLLSRKIVGEALDRADPDAPQRTLLELPSIKSELSATKDAVDFVLGRLELTKGGGGGAKSARSLLIQLSHPDAADAEKILTAVVARYERYLIEQVESRMGRATEVVRQLRDDSEAELVAAEEAHLKYRQQAPLFFQGEGSSNIYQERYRGLQDEMLDVDIQTSSLETRLEKVRDSLETMDSSGDPVDNLDKLALIDSASLERLGVFAGLQINASNSAEFKSVMPVRMEEARAEFTQLLQLNSEKQRLSSLFGPGHPQVQEIENQITLVKDFLRKNKEQTKIEGLLGNGGLSAEGLLKAYIGFLQHDIETLAEKRMQLVALSEDAEKKAKNLVEYELNDIVLQSNIRRQQSIFDSHVQQLRDLDVASGLTGYQYELLEVPRMGEKCWPAPIPCIGAGLLLGLLAGVSLGVFNDVRDGRFRSAEELDQAITTDILSRVGRLSDIKAGVTGLMQTESSREGEGFRLGRTVLLPKIKSGELRTIGFTSPMQGDGKSTIASNYAITFSQVGLRVLVLDADLRRPTVHRYFSVPIEEGLSDVLEGRMELDEVIKETQADNVSVVTAGALPKMPAELLQDRGFDDFLAAVKDQFDVVLVDIPPVLAV
ncbi:MAG: polysaccharide biosynthesis tyrosine autokinase, partial [Planctomycetota bacterium]